MLRDRFRLRDRLSERLGLGLGLLLGLGLGLGLELGLWLGRWRQRWRWLWLWIIHYPSLKPITLTTAVSKQNLCRRLDFRHQQLPLLRKGKGRKKNGKRSSKS